MVTGKNISFMRSPNGFVVAPWYDLVNIRLCDGIDQPLAMSIGEQFTFEDVHALQVLWEADRLTKIVENVFTALDKVKAPDFSTKEELLFTHRWKEDVKKACLKWRSEIKELPYLEL